MQTNAPASKDAPGKTPKGPDAVKASGSKGAPSTTTTSYAKAIGKQKPETVSVPPSGTTSPAVMLGLTDLDDGINTPSSDQLSSSSFLDDGLNTAFSARLDRASARIDLQADRYAEQQAIAMRADARMEAHIERSNERNIANQEQFSQMMAAITGLTTVIATRLPASETIVAPTTPIPIIAPIPTPSARPLPEMEEPSISEARRADDGHQNNDVPVNHGDSPLTTPTPRGVGESRYASGLPRRGAGMAAGLPATNQRTSFVDTRRRTSSQRRTPMFDDDDSDDGGLRAPSSNHESANLNDGDPEDPSNEQNNGI